MKLVPFGVVLGQDDDEALVELIEARWREGKIPGPVLGRRGHNHMHEKIENYQRLEIQWAAAPPKGDYYDGEYDSEAYAHPCLTNREHIGKDYYISVWKDLATTEQTLSRLRAEVPRTDLRPADARLLAHVEETAVAGKAGLPDDLRKLLDHNLTRSDQPMPDRAELRPLSEARVELREKTRIAIRIRQLADEPADVVEQKMQRSGADVDGELLRCLARDQLTAFLDTTYDVEQLPSGPYWLRPDKRPQPWAIRAFVSGTAPSVRHGNLAGTVMVRSDDFRAFGAQYLAAHGLADDSFLSAAPRPPARLLPPSIERAPEENSPLSRQNNAEAAISVPDQTAGKSPVTRRPSRLKPFWPEAHKVASEWLDTNGFPPPGDGGQAKLEKYIHEWLTARDKEVAESTVRVHVKAWIEQYKASVSAHD